MRSFVGGTSSSATYGRSCAGAVNGSPATMPATRSSTAAESRTLRATTCSHTRMLPPAIGAYDTRPRDGFNPNRPQQLAGMRIEPPPSLACAIGTMPVAVAHAEPPLEPPEPRVRSYGLRVGGHGGGSAARTVAG